MSEQKRQEDMRALGTRLARESFKNVIWEHCNFTLNWVTIADHLSTKGEIMIALSIYKEDDEFKYIIITDHNVYHTYGEKELETVPFLCPLYTFECPLTLDSAQILAYKGFYAVAVEKKLEAVIRTIPGAYKNGDWSQCDGFFGPYLNHEKKMMSPSPPLLE